MNAIQIIGIILSGLVVGIPIGFFIRKKIMESRADSIEKYSKKILVEAQQEARTIKKEASLQAKDALYQMKVEFRYPQTPLYKRYRESLRLLRLPKYQAEVVYTSYL